MDKALSAAVEMEQRTEQECQKAQKEAIRMGEEVMMSAGLECDMEELKSQITTEVTAIQEIFSRLQTSIGSIHESRKELQLEDTALDIIAAAHGVSLCGAPGFQSVHKQASQCQDSDAGFGDVEHESEGYNEQRDRKQDECSTDTCKRSYPLSQNGPAVNAESRALADFGHNADV